MDTKTKLNHLARKWLPTAVLLLKLANQVIELVSKVVNYARRVRELHALV